MDTAEERVPDELLARLEALEQASPRSSPYPDELLARLEALEQVSPRSQPFWQNTAAVGILAGVIAIIPASITAVHEYYQTEREVRLNTTKYEHERTVSYLDRALSPETTEAKQAQVLRFLRHLPENDPIHKWAHQELLKVEEAVEQLKDEVRGAEKKLASLENQKVALQAKAEQIQVSAEGQETTQTVEPLLRATQSELENTLRQIEKTEMQVKVAALRAGEPQLAEPVIGDLAGSDSARSDSRPWRIRIAANRDRAEIERLAAIVTSRGASPEVYAKSGIFYIFVTRHPTRDAANEHVAEAKRYLGQGAWVQDIEEFCPSPRKTETGWDCSAR